jgi:ATP-dependent helicase HrpB
LLIEGARYGNVKDTAICAALLSERDPIRRTNDKSGAQHKSESDVLDRVWALNEFAERGHKHSVIGELMVNQARQILRTADQLSRLVSEETAEKENATSSNEAPDNASLGASSSTESVADLIVRRALMAAFSDRICRRREPGSKSALMVGGRGVKLTDDSAVVDSEFFVAVEMIETGKSDASVRQASAIEKSWLPKSHLTSGIEVIFEAGRQKVVALKRTRFFDLLIEESVTSIPNDIDPGEILAAALNQSNTDLLALVDDDTKQFLARLSCLREHMPELNLPEFSSEPWRDLLPQWCMGLSSLAELKQHSLLPILQAQLTHEQLSTVEREAPERKLVPSGNRIKLEY